jgi:hypothetical protein
MWQLETEGNPIMSALLQGQFISICLECEGHPETQSTVCGIVLSEDPAKPSELFIYEELGYVRVRGFASRLEYRTDQRGDFFEMEEDFRSTAKTCMYSKLPFPIDLEDFREICSMLQ